MKIEIRANIIMSNFSFIDTDSKIFIFNTNCHSFYGSELIDLKWQDIDKLDCTRRVGGRRVLKGLFDLLIIVYCLT